MGHEAIPILQAQFVVQKEHPELQGKELTNAINKKVEDIKKQSAFEKKGSALLYRRGLYWACIRNQEEFDKERDKAHADYKDGNFLLERIGRYREVDHPLTLTLLNLRDLWIDEYDIKTAPEFMLLDMALTSYFHFIRLNEAINNTIASIEWDFFAQDAPRFHQTHFWSKKPYGKETDEAVAEELAHRLTEVLQPVIEQYNRMFIRNLKALRDLKRGNIQLNIGNVGQVNIGDKQINVGKENVN